MDVGDYKQSVPNHSNHSRFHIADLQKQVLLQLPDKRFSNFANRKIMPIS